MLFDDIETFSSYLIVIEQCSCLAVRDTELRGISRCVQDMVCGEAIDIVTMIDNELSWTRSIGTKVDDAVFLSSKYWIVHCVRPVTKP